MLVAALLKFNLGHGAFILNGWISSKGNPHNNLDQIALQWAQDSFDSDIIWFRAIFNDI